MTFLLESICFVPVAVIMIVVALCLAFNCDKGPDAQEETDPQEIEQEKISEYPEGKKYRNIFEIVMSDGSIRIEGYSNSQHTVNSFIMYCDRVNRRNDGITILYRETESIYVPMEEVQRITVSNEDIC